MAHSYGTGSGHDMIQLFLLDIMYLVMKHY